LALGLQSIATTSRRAALTAQLCRTVSRFDRAVFGHPFSDDRRRIMKFKSTHDACEAIRREHEELRERIGRIHRALALEEISDLEVSAMLRELCMALESHFENEENDGFIDEVTAHDPRLTSAARRLCREHQEMLRTATEMARFATTGANSKTRARELRSRFQAFRKQLMHHESDENGLMQQAYQEDIGAHD
jgi:hemerythrin